MRLEKKFSLSDDGMIGIREKFIEGVWFSTGRTLVVKGAAFAGQVAVAGYLTPNDFAMIACSGAISGFTALLAFSGIKEFLVQRNHTMHVWWGSACLVSPLLAAASVVSALFVANFYQFPGDQFVFIKVQFISATSGAVNALALTLSCRLNIDMAHRRVSVIDTGYSLVNLVASVLLARAGSGVYSIPVAMLLAALTRAWLVRDQIACAVFQARWIAVRRLLAKTWSMFATSVISLASTSAAPLVLSHSSNANQAGIYFFAYNIGSQVIQLIASNVVQVLMPTISRLYRTGHSHRAFYLSVTKAASVALTPFCLLQATFSDVFIQSVFDHKWRDASSVLSILSLAMIPHALSISYASVLMSTNRWAKLLIVSSLTSILTIVAIFIGSRLGGALGVATAILGSSWITAIYSLGVATDSWGSGQGGWLFSLAFRPIICSALALLLIFTLILPCARVGELPLIQSLSAACVLLAVYVVLYISEIGAMYKLMRSRNYALWEIYEN